MPLSLDTLVVHLPASSPQQGHALVVDDFAVDTVYKLLALTFVIVTTAWLTLGATF
ncbi:hypothetical protein ACSSV1_005037 [Labrenzia sp. MBR-25]